MIKKFLLGSAALVALGVAAPASAADLAARPYTKAPAIAPGYNWSGFYAGVIGGYVWDGVNGGFGGGTFGYNWQAPGSNWLFGLEADAVGASAQSSATGLVLGIPLTATDKITAFGSVTGRVGVTTGPVLLYAKGGYGFAENQASLSLLGVTFSDSKTHSGWTAGAGAEYLFAQNWSTKVEYMYADYGTQTYLATIAPPGVGLHPTTSTIKVGVNYHFN